MAPTAKVNVRPTKSVLPTLDGQYLGTDYSPTVTGYSNTVSEKRLRVTSTGHEFLRSKNM